MEPHAERIQIGPGSAWANLVWLFVFTVLGASIFLLSANFTRREQARGQLVAEPQIIRVSAPRPGRVRTIAAREGQPVNSGDVLFVLEPEPVLVNGRPLAEVDIERLRLAENELKARIGTIQQQVAAKSDELDARISAVGRQIGALLSSIELQRANVTALSDQLRIGRKLQTSGTLSATEFAKRTSALRDAEISEQTLNLSMQQQQELLAELEGQKRQAPIEGELKISDLRQSLLEIGQRRAQAQGELTFQVTAPVAGLVDTVMISQGQMIGANAPLVSILPNNAKLVAELYVPSRAIVFVEPEQAVRIAYNAFPYVRYGFATGRIASVSEAILRPDELRGAFDVQEPSYRVTVVLDSQSMKSGDKDIRLRPGLSLNADIILDRQTLAQWIYQSVAELWSRL